MDSNSDTFSIKEVVWAKVKGHPHWPGFITEINNAENKYKLHFFGDNTRAIVKLENIFKFEEGKSKNFHVTKKKKLVIAIDQAENFDPNKYELMKQTNSNIEEANIVNNDNEMDEEIDIDKPKKNTRTIKDKTKKNLMNGNGEKNIHSKADENIESENGKVKNNNVHQVIAEKNVRNLKLTKNVKLLGKKRKKGKKNKSSKNKHGIKYNTSLESAMNQIDETLDCCEDEVENDSNSSLLMKITQYLYTILNSFDQFNISEEKQLIMEILDKLSLYKLYRPVEFLKKYGLGIIISKIREYCKDDEINNKLDLAKKNLESQVLCELFPEVNQQLKKD